MIPDHDTTVAPTGPFRNSFEAYSASKVFARHATDDFVRNKRPSFDIINVMPSFLIGKNELVTNLRDIEKGPNRFALAAIRGYHNQPVPGTTVHVDDAAMVHVRALATSYIPGGNDPIYDHFLASSGSRQGTIFNDAIDIVKANFKQQVEEGLFPMNGTQPVKAIMLDSDRTQKVFGFAFADFTQQVVSVVGHYIELAREAGVKTAEDLIAR